MSPLAYVIAPTIGTIIIREMPLKNIFIFLAIFMLVAGLLTIKRITSYEKTT
jgi:4-hydroxybenzoate polyprenyltransferase